MYTGGDNIVTGLSTVADVLADWAARQSWEAHDDGTRASVLNAIIDTVGVTIAGAAKEEFAPVRAFGETDATGHARLLVDDRPVPAATAAFLNGTAGHLLDFDDVHSLIHGHPSTVIFPAVLATAEEVDASTDALLRGYLVGVGVMAAIARAFGPEHYSAGWHSTSTCGVIGAAAGSALVRGLDRDGIANAIVVAVSVAQGVRANFGTLLKPMHAGFAARGGVEAAHLSAVGVNAARNAVEGRLGALDLFSDGSWTPSSDGALEQILADATQAPRDLALKLYPCCRGSHFAVDAALEAREQLPEGAVIETIEMVVPLGTKTALIHDDPQTGLQAKFSLPYTTCTSLARGLPLIEHFDDGAIHDAGVRDLMGRLTVVMDESNGDLSATMVGRYADITVVTADGDRFHSRVEDARGSETRPLTDSEVDQKFLGAVAGVRGPDYAEELLTRLRGLPTADGIRSVFTIA